MSELQPAIDFITRTRRFVITAHETPDGDAIGSEVAMVRALRSIGKEAIVLNADPTPRKFAFLGADRLITVLDGAGSLPSDLAEYSLLMLDTNDVHNIGQVATQVLPRVREHFIIDHHENEEDLVAGNLIKKNASSTSEVIWQILEEMRVEIDYEIAEALYTGILFDTGCFIYPKTTAITFAIARDLVNRGVQPNAVYAHVYESNSISALILHSKVLSTLELVIDSHVAILTMTRGMIAESGANYEEADQLINIPLKSEDIRVSIFFKENMEGLLRCSMRSKGNINVAEIAQAFNGGGHRTAAGFKCRDSVDKTRAIVLDKLRAYFS
jgi:bifunctional oligoribonuclease and PAP phosphatase NrnA